MTNSERRTDVLTSCEAQSIIRGVCRSGVTPCRRPALSLETSAIWDESGFLPPERLALEIELLHHLCMAGSSGGDLIRSLVQEILARTEDPQALDDYIVTEQREMIRTAIACGVPVAGRRLEDVARAIARAFIADYLPDRGSA